MNHIEISDGWYASHWGLTDFYEKSKATLMNALNGGEDFDTGWFGCKKEIRYARICREAGKITVEVSANMDNLYDEDGPDLVYDALWEEFHIEEDLPEEILDGIIEEACDVGVDDKSIVSETLSAAGTGAEQFDAIVEAMGRLEGEAEDLNTGMYTQLRVIVREWYEYWKGLEAGESGAAHPAKNI